MHVERRKTGKKVKYYLAHSYREGNKVHKFRKYLGTDLPATLLEERHKIAEKLILEEIHKYNIISGPIETELAEEDIRYVEQLQKEVPLKIHHLSEKNWEEFSKIFTYNTNAIEGSKINQHEVKELLDNDKWPDKSKEDIAETFGVDEAIQFVRTTKEPLSIDLMKKIHKIVFKNSKPFAGKVRKKGEEVVVLGKDGVVVHEGAPQERVLPLLKKLVQWYEDHNKKYPGLILAAVVHNQFENIHPFVDGNGRVGRILLNYVLIRHGLPPINIDFKNRHEYYGTLQAFDKNKDVKPTIDLFMKEYKALQKMMKK